MNLTVEHLTELRNYLKEFKATPVDASHQENADVINGLIPALVDTITDEELTVMTADMWAYVMTGIIAAPPGEGGLIPPDTDTTDIADVTANNNKESE